MDCNIAIGKKSSQKRCNKLLMAAEIFGKLKAMEHHAPSPSSLIWLWLLVTFGEPLVTFVTALSKG